MQWIWFTVMAAVMQSVRTAGQKKMAQTINVWTVTYVRFLFGWPVAVLLCLSLLSSYQSLSLHPKFFLFVIIAALGQLWATFFSVHLLGRRNFATGATLLKSEAAMTALLGMILFAEQLSFLGWLSILLSVAGLILSTVVHQNVQLKTIVKNIDSKSALLGLSAGSMFAVSSVFIRQASFAIDGVESTFARAMLVLVSVLSIQSMIAVFVIVKKQRYCIADIKNNLQISSFIGLTSVLGSVGWFAAYAYQNAALVKVVGQVDFIFLTLITVFYFKEKIARLEWLAMLMIVLSVIMLVI